ncbi:cytochrome c biogenesis protein CcmG [Novimethylophilus kurashikiensis]|uniref:Cytochrome c biogenesis protein CcmG n=1 Tax=Novimethylophilus kurashikiensis TaxID=1825523 RepID=A0A2R5F2Y7_9PROT|nr:DsbE family thiol:disulfide interchange protein [Novimethylophilus kurashikiensis]GBG12926.1 cytochrome c biogenesis protein CcmG [Novimethylophilus kurashikiensis]
MKPAFKYLLPLAIFLVLVGFFAAGLKLDPREVPSPLIDKPAPAFRLPVLNAAGQTFSPEDMRGQVWLLNVWASWCGACREEHPVLMAMAQRGEITLVGLDYKDTDAEASGVLTQAGNPYKTVAVDADGRVGIDYGVYGVPETYVIDKAGVIRYKQIGPVTDEALHTKILPLIKGLQ